MDPSPFEPVAIDLRHYVTFHRDRPAGHRVVATDVLAVDVLCVEPQQTLRARTHADADAVYTVIGGKAWVVVDDAEVVLEPLQSVLVPAGTPHGLRNSSADPLILQVVVSPPDGVPAPQPGETAPAVEEPRPGLIDRLRRRLGSA